MKLHALTTGQLLTLLGVLGAIVVVLYILKLRRRRVAVPFARLWNHVLREKETTALFSRLKRLLSLLVQLLLLAALGFALGDPRLEGARTTGRHLVVLLDASASMQARDVAGGTRLSEGIRRVRKIVRGMSGPDRMLLARMDAEVTPLTPMTDDEQVLLAALERVKASDAPADFARAMRFATDSLAGLSDPEVVVVSDGAGMSEPEDELGKVTLDRRVRLSFVRVGKTGRNVAITAFSVRRFPLDKSTAEVYVELRNTGEREEQVELTLLGDGEPLGAPEKLLVPPGEPLRRLYPPAPAGDRQMEAVIRLASGERDDLPADDRAYAVLPERRHAKILAVTPGNLYLSAALLVDSYLDVTEIAPAQYTPGSTEGYDVAIFDGFVPPAPPPVPALWLHPSGEGSPIRVEGVVEAPAFGQVAERHPVMRWIALGDVNVAEASHLRPERGDTVLVADDAGVPLVVARDRAGNRQVALGWDLRKSDLPLRIAWPLFVLNSIDWMVGEDAQYLSSFRAGTTFRIPVSTEADTATVKDPDGQESTVPVVDGRAIYFGQRRGFYEVKAAGVTTRFAVNLGAPTESSVRPPSALTVDGRRAGPVSGFRVGVRREIWLYLLLFALGIVIVEWLTFHRRVTV